MSHVWLVKEYKFSWLTLQEHSSWAWTCPAKMTRLSACRKRDMMMSPNWIPLCLSRNCKSIDPRRLHYKGFTVALKKAIGAVLGCNWLSFLKIWCWFLARKGTWVLNGCFGQIKPEKCYLTITACDYHYQTSTCMDTCKCMPSPYCKVCFSRVVKYSS